MSVNVNGIIDAKNWKYPQSAIMLKSFVDFQLVNIAKLTEGVSPESADRVQTRLVESLVELVFRAETKLTMPFGGSNPASNEFGVAPLRPQHFASGTANQIGYTNESRWQWTAGGSASNKWVAEDTMVNATLDKDEFALVYGYFNNDAIPNTIELFFQPGATKLPIYNIEYMRALGSKPKVLLIEPIIVEATSGLVVLVAARTVSIAEDAGLLGYFAAPTSKLITKTF